MHIITAHAIHTPRHASGGRTKYKMNNNSTSGHCYNFVCIQRSWTFSDPYFSFDRSLSIPFLYVSQKREKKLCIIRSFKFAQHTIVFRSFELFVERMAKFRVIKATNQDSLPPRSTDSSSICLTIRTNHAKGTIYKESFRRLRIVSSSFPAS